MSEAGGGEAVGQMKNMNVPGEGNALLPRGFLSDPEMVYFTCDSFPLTLLPLW